ETGRAESVFYRLDSGVNETADSFRFSVEDQGGNHLAAQEFKLNWSWISLEEELYEVNETDKVVLVQLRRRGFLGETSFPWNQNGTALTDEDLHPSYAHQVQFNPGQKEAQWRLRLQDDEAYEGAEISRVAFEVASLAVEEDVGELKVDLVRRGEFTTDSSLFNRFQAMTVPQVRSRRESRSRLSVVIDTCCKRARSHSLWSYGLLGRRSRLCVDVSIKIRVPLIFFGESEYNVDESAGSLEVTVWRTGTDLSRVASVQVASKALHPAQAQGRLLPGSDGRDGTTYHPDDLGVPTLEGPEMLQLVLRVPVNASLGDPAIANVTINDLLSDLPKCFTRQRTAEVGLDFDERPDTNASYVHFQPGEVERPCKVILVNDHLHEEDETLLLRLGSPASPSAGGGLLGPRNTSVVTIKDKADRSTIYLEEARVSVEEPLEAGEQRSVRMGVARGGDTSSTVAVRIHTKDGSAVSGADYFGFSKGLRHPVRCPTSVPGYPVICVTACDSKHPDFEKTGPLCARQGINQTLSSFRWRVAAPSGYDGVSKELKDVSSDTFFTSTRGITLDSVYFSSGSRVQCIARAYSVEGAAGLELASAAVSIEREGGLCPPRYQGTFGADPFTAKLHYTGPDDERLPNLVRVEVVIPHRDGMIPVLSTRPLTNFELTLSRDGIRIGNHRCSNLLDFHEVRTEHGFVTNETRSPELVDAIEPYQFSSDLRSPASLRFYRALDLESCLWRWVGYYTMSELVIQCGGDTTTDGQVLDVVQSYVSVVVPLYVSYIFHSPVATGGWQHTDLTTHLRLSFVYDTSILWRQGIGAPATSELDGHLYPTAMRIREDGRLVVSFRTEARFRGIFVKTHHAVTQRSSVTCEEHPDLTFTLELLRSQPTYAQPEQQWQFVSDFAVRDYSGRYKVHLLPCTVTEDVAYSLPLLCNPRESVEFDLQVRFQQVSDPVPEEFTLSTLFHLMRRRALWLSDLTTDYDTESDVSFYPGERIYGRVMIDPVQALGVGFHVTLEKCFICTGVDGYVPKYNPATDEYGCVADSPNLLHNFKIIDKGAPDSVKFEYQGKAFNARLAVEDAEPDVIALLNQPGADGFSLDSTPLFEVAYGRQWFIHCIYTVRSEENAARGIGKRDVSSQGRLHHAVAAFAPPQETQRRAKRARQEPQAGDDGRGTNMHRLSLQLRPKGSPEPGITGEDSPFPLIPLLVALACVVAVGSVAAAVVLARRRQGKVLPPGYMTVAGNGTSATYRNPHPVDPRYYHTHEDNTEV
ncbi:FRAS1-related extracellular matrix protein 2-like, partial [Penaeus japonicus]|uniref:FRAS1-related extracellular matrix protein 2-like n=1 Tax=Penaeus japonicus TaxID=27405 RepID=UPI001C7112C2